ncbi:hypothetical protein [Streptomyces sp. WAC06614]|uniref:hypothetical protein n=1 Tax=Streptomyces sp. WAC06614 TaxID=2487416 RepID=UPI000F7B9CD7|nr:hypothetical protein [Streptomyces sp. WAC06614]RSS76921.1 hypothetical protein EF918_22295 [Streptomyces sp. WAC06614]
MGPIRAAACAVVVAAFAASVMGCTASDGEPKASPSVKRPTVDLTEACPGLISDAAGQALKDVLQSSHLANDDGQTVGVTAVGKGLEAAYRAGPKAREAAVPSCRVTGIVGSGKRVGELRFAGDAGGGGTADRTGVQVTRADKERGVSFDCVSRRAGSTRESPLRITAVYKDLYLNSRGDAELGEDYVTLAHSAALAVAKDLGCEADGGLPAAASALPKA